MTVTLGRPIAPDPAVFADLSAGVWDRARWSNGGPLVAALERQLERSQGWQHVTMAASGTAALTAALVALDLPRGGEVITTPLTFRATALAIEAAGLVPVFAAVDPQTLNLAPDAVVSAIGPRSVAIVPVHLFGVPANRALDGIGEDHGLPVVYDAAHAFGLRSVSGRGALTAYSLHATKLLHTGEGGFIATDSASRDQRARQSVNFGIDGAAGHAGVNGKLSEIAAAVGLAVVPTLDVEIAARERLRLSYSRAVATSPRVWEHAPGHERALVMHVVRCAPADQVSIVAELAERGIVARAFPALCDGGWFADRDLYGASVRETIELASSAIALPFHSGVNDAHVQGFSEVIGS